MAPSASATARAHLLSELTRSRASSPYDDNAFTTATATSFRDAIHSTPQRQEWTSTQQLPLNYDEVPSPRSDDTLDLSIEMGRGVKRSSRTRDDDVSSHAVFQLGDDSRYDATATPMSARSGQRKTLGSLQKEASLRRALASSKDQDAKKRNVYGTKPRAVSDGLPGHNSDNDSIASKDNQNPTATLNIRASRFTSVRSVSQSQAIPSRFTSGQGLFDREGTPMRAAANNPTIQSATYTANQSFMLPDLPNITELVAGVRKDGTPVFNRAGKSRSRFTSATYKPQPPSFAPVTSIPLPEDEKAIFASLQLLKDRITQLEAENSEAHKRAEEYVGEIIDLRSQLQVASRSPDSAIGSDDDTEGGKSSKATITRLQANVKAMQDRLERAERKTSVAEITVKRVTNERDALITQIGSAYFCNEELTKENEIFRDSHGKLQAENEDLKTELTELRADNERLRQKLARSKSSKVPDHASPLDAAANTDAPVERVGQEQKEKSRSRKVSAAPVSEGQSKQDPELTSQSRVKIARRSSQGQTSSNDTQDLASRIEQEIMKYRQGIVAKPVSSRQTRSELPRSTSARTRSKSQHRQDPVPDAPAGHKRTHSAPGLQADLSEGDSTTTLDMTRASKREKSRERQQSRSEFYNESRELTSLSPWHTEEILDLAAMRRKLEEELQAKKRASTQGLVGDDYTSRSGTQGAIPRKSSLKDISGRFDQGTGRLSLDDAATLDQIRISKTVRVQSPHTSDAMSQAPYEENDTGEISIMSNTSRRRRRALSAEGDTSAFIIPDITLHGAVPLPINAAKNCIHHDVSNCTACAGATGKVSIPQPTPVSDRDLDLTNATIRPSQPPEIALANVIKHLEDEITHLKIQREAQNRPYNQHDPALSRRRRLDVKAKLDSLTAEIEKRSDQVYSLYDVLEGQKQQAAQAAAKGEPAATPMGEDELNETLTSIGIDPAELAGRVSRSAPSAVPAGLGGTDDLSYVASDDELPWEGLSDVESVESRM